METAKEDQQQENTGWFRRFEFVPGVLAWGTLLGAVVCSRLVPAWTALFIVAFDVYWFLKTVYLSLHLRVAFRQMRRNLGVNWRERVQNTAPEAWKGVYHLVILPMYQEPYELVRETFLSLKNANYPKDRLIVVLACEGRAPEGIGIGARIVREFQGEFFRTIVTVHPAGLPGEVPGKGSNETWAAKEVKEKIIDPSGIPYRNILVSVFDVDTQVLPEYFGILTHSFLTCPFPQRSSFQPVPLFTNNIYQTPALGRVISFSSTFWHMIQQARPERVTTFSSHAMPFAALVEIGFWNTNVVSEDSQIFWQCYLYYHGDWRVVPILYPVSMDANVAPTFWQTMGNIYRQQRRWAWGGCENIPYFLEGFRRDKKLPFRKKLYWAFHYIEGFHSWATNSIIIFVLGWLPVLIGGSEFNVSVLSYNLPRITRSIMSFAMVGIVSSAILSIILLPPKPAWFKKRHYVLYFLQWVFMPITMIVFGAIPALEAQTRVMLGGNYRLGFWVTPKFRTQDIALLEEGQKSESQKSIKS
ncbi:MAG: glycosyltransferase family 2 protein [Candidatus Sungbacteria bacterium]|nr:glycosyltransferase family 2 protein [Candidatus Sungbacteria bacterium]